MSELKLGLCIFAAVFSGLALIGLIVVLVAKAR